MDRNGALDGRPVTAEDLGKADGDALPQPFAQPAVPVHIEPATSLIPHLTADVGDSLCHDALNQYLVDELLSFGRSGKLIADETETGGLPAQTLGIAPLDTDGDGIPDAWEKPPREIPERTRGAGTLFALAHQRQQSWSSVL